MNPHLAQMKIRLEEVLDEHFPKIEEEEPEKIANKRGAALILYGEAMMLAQEAIVNAIKDDRKRFNGYIEHNQQCVLQSLVRGEPTGDGGYRQKFGETWYQASPVDETPKCDCGLSTLLNTPS